MRPPRAVYPYFAALGPWLATFCMAAWADEPVFEKNIRPILVAKCGKCHGEATREANLDLRTVAALRRGGDSGPAIASGAPSQGALWERIEEGDMPPDDQPPLTKAERDVIRLWLQQGAKSDGTPAADAWTQRLEEAKRYWAFQPPVRPPLPGAPAKESPTLRPAISPNDRSISNALEAWYRAESLSLDGERIEQWIDESGHARHLRPTWGRVDSNIGAPPRFVRHSTLDGKPAVRFDDIAGLGSPADNPVNIHGDAPWTITSVVNVRPPNLDTHTSVLVGFGDPAPGHNPGRPWAALLEVHRGAALLSHSGGFGHNAQLQPQTMWGWYDRPLVLTVVKQPGAMAETTSLYVNGRRINAEQITGASTSPEIQHRSDFGVYMGRANRSLGAFRGDVAEVAIYSEALEEEQRASLEAGLLRKYGMDSAQATGPPASPHAIHPIDAFVQRKLSEKGLPSAHEADRRTLIRRAYFDLIGLPPSPNDVAAFVEDQQPGAWERVIERLLHSQHYGERWGRHWLDVARYADTGGYETDVYYRNAWRYRDYVVRSFNADKPYDQFVQEQIAGDEIWPDNLDLHGSYVMDPEQKRHFEAQTGTGFYALGPQIHESNMDASKLTNERLRIGPTPPRRRSWD